MYPTVGRLLLAIPIAIFGAFHMMNAVEMKSMVPAALPGGVFWVYLSGVALIAAALAIILQKMAKLAAILLAVMLILFAVLVHMPKFLGGDQLAMGSVLKDLAIAGGALILASTEKN